MGIGAFGGDYPQTCVETNPSTRPNLKRRLLQEKQVHEDRLHKVDNVLEMLDSNPEVEKILNAISELGAF